MVFLKSSKAPPKLPRFRPWITSKLEDQVILRAFMFHSQAPICPADNAS